MIAMSPSAEGNIGQRQAVELLVSRGIYLREANLSYAHLVEAKMAGANLWTAN